MPANTSEENLGTIVPPYEVASSKRAVSEAISSSSSGHGQAAAPQHPDGPVADERFPFPSLQHPDMLTGPETHFPRGFDRSHT